MLTVVQPRAAITVLRVGNNYQDLLHDSGGVELSEMLARHDLKTTLEHRHPVGDGIADVLNKTAFEKGADLIFTGAFGHSKAYDFVLGATTHALLRDAQIPVMFSK
jgi:nucleotide-binding universal stress UspA family protein